MTENIRGKLFELIRSGMDLEVPNVLLSVEECKELFEFATRQSIQSIVFRGMKKAGIPEEIMRGYDRNRLKETFQVIQQESALKCVGMALEEAKIPYILLKGAVLRGLYPVLDLRTSCDIDILVQEETLIDAVQSIERQTDFKTVKKAYHDVSMMNSNVHLELHFSIKENAENIDRLLSRAWEYANQIDAEGYRFAFAPEYMIFYTVAHMSHHFLHGGLGIRPFLDLWLLRNKTEYDEATVKALCAECGIQKFYEECCNLTQVWFEKKEHTETTEILEKVCLSGGVFGIDQFRTAARQRKKRGFKYIVNRIFPPAYEVREFYRDEEGKKHTLLYYYIKRLISWFGKTRRVELKKQVNEIMSADHDYLDLTEDLFNRLEL